MTYFNPGDKLKKGQYEIIEILGSGGFGITYLAKDHKRKKQVAIKTLNLLFLQQRYREKHGNSEGFQQFLAEEQDSFNSEAMKLATFDHPHIVKVYPELFQENGLSCMVMEYVQGKDLEQHLRAKNLQNNGVNSVFSEGEGLAIIQQIGSALDYIHSRNYLHRDIKPANILLRESDNQAILIDFGLAREVDFDEIISLTNAKTPPFAPPEQFENRSNFTPALDIYSLAATLFVIIAINEPPYIPLPSPHLNAKMMLDFNIPMQPPNTFNSKISQKVNDAIMKGMELDYQKRPQSIKEWFTYLGINTTNNVQHPPNNIPDPRQTIPFIPHLSNPIYSNLRTFSFEVVTTNPKGAIIERRNHTAQCFMEDLGNGVKLEMVSIPAGTFYRGSPESEQDRSSDESPRYLVTVPAFFMSKYPLTQAQYQAIIGKNPSYFQGDKYPKSGNRPVEQVSWDDAVAFCQKLSSKTGKNYKLPSEAQWEYACRAGTTSPFYFGESITPSLVNYNGNYPYASAPKGEYRQQTTDVGSFPPNAFGLYDMHGNVWEWCEDDYEENYTNAPIDGSALINPSAKYKLLRGGSWLNYAGYCRSAFRSRSLRDGRSSYCGFRVVFFSRTL